MFLQYLLYVLMFTLTAMLLACLMYKSVGLQLSHALCYGRVVCSIKVFNDIQSPYIDTRGNHKLCIMAKNPLRSAVYNVISNDLWVQMVGQELYLH